MPITLTYTFVPHTTVLSSEVNANFSTLANGVAAKNIIGENVNDYGAVADGTTNNATAIGNAVAAANTAGHGVVLFPPATSAYSSTGAIANSANTTQLFLGSNITGTTATTANLNLIRFIDGAIELGVGDSMRNRMKSGDHGVMLQGQTADGNTYWSVMPPAGTTSASASCGFQAHSFYTDASNYSAVDFEAYTQNASTPYGSIKSRVGAVSGSHLPFLFQIGGHMGPNINTATATLCTCPYDKDTGGAAAPGRYVYGAAAQGDLVLGFAGGAFLWQVLNDHSAAYRLIGGDSSDRVVLDKDAKTVIHGSGVVLFDAAGHLGASAAVASTRAKDGTSNYTPGDTTLNVQDVTYAEITNTAPTIITNFTNGITGQIITLKFLGTAATTVNRNFCLLAGGVNFVSGIGGNNLLTLIKGTDGLWQEISRATTNS